ncbi:hypothetical protein VT06_15260 [Arsukibacterium sp. MJ3]|nr:hypothetical protein VT06_15260 [Arsukibacterium sp. MJ3]
MCGWCYAHSRFAVLTKITGAARFKSNILMVNSNDDAVDPVHRAHLVKKVVQKRLKIGYMVVASFVLLAKLNFFSGKSISSRMKHFFNF